MTRGPGCSDPSACMVYVPMSPSSAFETYTNVPADAVSMPPSVANAATVKLLAKRVKEIICCLPVQFFWNRKAAESFRHLFPCVKVAELNRLQG